MTQAESRGPDDALWLGFDIGGTKLAVALGDATGRLVARRRRPIAASGDPRADLDAMLTDGRALLDEAGVDAGSLAGVGVSAPGPIDPARGTVESPPNLPGWKSVAVVGTFSEAFGVPAHLENDANAAALAEWRFGAGQGARNLVYLTMSTGVGGGLVLDGRLYRGAGGAGEVGHMPVVEDGEPCGCGRRGCLEAYVGGRCWTERLRRETPADSGVAAHAGGAERAGPEHVIAAAREGDAFALAELERWNAHLSRGLAILAFTLDPDVFVLGTIAAAAGEALCLEPQRRGLRARLGPDWGGRIDVRPSALGPDGAYYAALCAALEGARR